MAPRVLVKAKPRRSRLDWLPAAVVEAMRQRDRLRVRRDRSSRRAAARPTTYDTLSATLSDAAAFSQTKHTAAKLFHSAKQTHIASGNCGIALAHPYLDYCRWPLGEPSVAATKISKQAYRRSVGGKNSTACPHPSRLPRMDEQQRGVGEMQARHLGAAGFGGPGR